MFQRKPKRFRHRSNGRDRVRHGNGHTRTGLRSNSFSNNQTRNNFRTTLSPEKLLEKYNTLAKEAMSSGDKTLSENYLQHADHFMRIIEDKNRNKNQNKIEIDDKLNQKEKNLSGDGQVNNLGDVKNKD